MKKLMMITITLILTNLNLQSQFSNDDSWSKQSVTLFGDYSLFLGDYGATYDAGLGIGAVYDYRPEKSYSFSGLLEYQSWSDVRNGNKAYPNRNFIDNIKLGAIAKGYFDAPQGFDAYFGLGISYNLIEYVLDTPAEGLNNSFQRFKTSDNSLGIDGVVGVRTGIYDNIKADIMARLGWLGIENSTFIVGFSVGITYELDFISEEY
jgi:hypothetical protein